MTTPANPDDLLAWLQAQLDTDVRLIDEYEAYMTERAAAAGSYVLVTPPGWQPGEPFDPDRQRAEVDAKRRILDRHRPHLLKAQTFRPAMLQCEHCADLCHSRSGLGCDEPIDAPWPCPDIRDMASVHSDREGFREEWRPA